MLAYITWFNSTGAMAAAMPDIVASDDIQSPKHHQNVKHHKDTQEKSLRLAQKLGVDVKQLHLDLAAGLSQKDVIKKSITYMNDHYRDKVDLNAIDNMPSQKRSVVISGAGDRRDEDIRQQTEILGDAFDDVILYQDACQRGRVDGEVIALLREGLANARRTKQIEAINGEFLAIDTALARLQPGDLCLILIDQVDDALAHIAKRISEAG